MRFNDERLVFGKTGFPIERFITLAKLRELHAAQLENDAFNGSIHGLCLLGLTL